MVGFVTFLTTMAINIPIATTSGLSTPSLWLGLYDSYLFVMTMRTGGLLTILEMRIRVITERANRRKGTVRKSAWMEKLRQWRTSQSQSDGLDIVLSPHTRFSQDNKRNGEKLEVNAYGDVVLQAADMRKSSEAVMGRPNMYFSNANLELNDGEAMVVMLPAEQLSSNATMTSGEMTSSIMASRRDSSVMVHNFYGHVDNDGSSRHSDEFEDAVLSYGDLAAPANTMFEPEHK